MKTQLLKAAAAVTIAAAAILAPVAANAYTPDAPAGSTTVAPGGTVTIAFTGFAPNESVSFTLTGENASGASLAFVKFAFETDVALGSLPADAAGAVSPTVTLPADASGTYVLTATGSESGETVDATILVSGAALPPTGSDSAQLLGLWIGGGALLLAGGGIAVASTVRRNRKEVAA